MRAVLVDRTAPGGLVIHEVSRPCPCAREALVRVAATSLNRGEVERALFSGVDGERPGSDLAGTVEFAAADGSGPRAGARVAGLVREGAWAELVAVPADALAEIPTVVSFANAAALPVAGLTALHALGQGSGLLAAKRVLITGATGGVGLFAVQLARLSGACAVAAIRGPEHEALVEEYGADHVVVGEVAVGAAEFGPYHLILDAVGGPVLAAALGLLREGGTCVSYGDAGASGAALIEGHGVLAEGETRLQVFRLLDALRREPASEGLERLLSLVALHAVRPHVEVETGWAEVAAVARRLLDRAFVGKAVLHL